MLIFANLPVLRDHAFNGLPEIPGVVGMDPVCQLMDDDVLESGLGQEEECGIEGDRARRGAASPARGHQSQPDRSEIDLQSAVIEIIDQRFHECHFLLGDHVPEQTVQASPLNVRPYREKPDSISLPKRCARAGMQSHDSRPSVAKCQYGFRGSIE